MSDTANGTASMATRLRAGASSANDAARALLELHRRVAPQLKAIDRSLAKALKARARARAAMAVIHPGKGRGPTKGDVA
jgi:hypothetical protein